MSNKVYLNYVQSTNYYKNLESAITKSAKIINNIEELIKSLQKPNGDVIMSAIGDLEKFRDKVDSIKDYYNALLNSIKTNADKYDRYLNSRKNDIGRITNNSIKKWSGSYNMTYSMLVYPKTDEYINRELSTITSVERDSGTGYVKIKTLSISIYGSVKWRPSNVNKYNNDPLYSVTLIFNFEKPSDSGTFISATNFLKSANFQVDSSYSSDLYDCNGNKVVIYGPPLPPNL